MTRLADLEELIENRDAKVAVVGLGYVGLPLALAFADAGFDTLGIDMDARKVQGLGAGRSHVGDVPDEVLKSALGRGRFRATSSFSGLSEVDCVHVCVPTPLRQTREPDVSFILAVVEEIRKRLRTGQLIVLGSTTYPGTTQELYLPILAETGLQLGHDFSLAFAPERIDPGNRDFAIHQVPKVVGGETALCTRLASRMYAAIFDEVIEVSGTRAAEMVKLLENTFRMINIGLANELAQICDRLGLDAWEVIDAAATKPYGFMKFEPGPGLGGHCIPVDPNYLSWKMRSLNFNARFIELASDVSQGMPGWVVDRIQRMLNLDQRAVNGSRILLLGLAYKGNVSDTRESPALDIFSALEGLGADVRYHDAHVPEVRIGPRLHCSVGLDDDELDSADLVVILTAHDGVDYARVCARSIRVFDTRNATRDIDVGDNVELL